MQWLTVTLCEQRAEVAKQDASITADNALSCNRSLQAGSPCQPPPWARHQLSIRVTGIAWQKSKT